MPCPAKIWSKTVKFVAGFWSPNAYIVQCIDLVLRYRYIVNIWNNAYEATAKKKFVTVLVSEEHECAYQSVMLLAVCKHVCVSCRDIALFG